VEALHLPQQGFHRHEFSNRTQPLVQSPGQIDESLQECLRKELGVVIPHTAGIAAMLPASARICAMFPGQGTQFVGMGKKLAKSHRVAAEVFEEVDEAVQFRLSRLMFEGPAVLCSFPGDASP
jgi:acyl transferase domain-containing protein